MGAQYQSFTEAKYSYVHLVLVIKFHKLLLAEPKDNTIQNLVFQSHL